MYRRTVLSTNIDHILHYKSENDDLKTELRRLRDSAVRGQPMQDLPVRDPPTRDPSLLVVSPKILSAETSVKKILDIQQTRWGLTAS